MADNYLITGYWGEPHVTAENDRGIHAGIFGAGRFVLPVGEQFNAEYIGNNTVRMYDGKLMDNGAAAGIPAGKYVDLLIPSAGQGMYRNDLIVFQYSIDESTLVESGSFLVIPGVETSVTPSDPALIQQDLLTGKAKIDQYALWRVSVYGSTISAPEKLFAVAANISTAGEAATEAKTAAENATRAANGVVASVEAVQGALDAHKKDTANPHGVTKTQVGLSNVPNVATNDQTPTYTAASSLAGLTSGEKLSVAFGKIAKAIADFISHIGNKSNPHNVTAAQVGADASGSASNALASAKSYTDTKAGEALTAANNAASAASAAQTAANNAQNTANSKAPAYTYGTTDMIAGSSTLETGKLYFVYE